MDVNLPRRGLLSGIASKLYLIILLQRINIVLAAQPVTTATSAEAVNLADKSSQIVSGSLSANAIPFDSSLPDSTAPVDTSAQVGVKFIGNGGYLMQPYSRPLEVSSDSIASLLRSIKMQAESSSLREWSGIGCGDIDGNAHINISDAVHLIAYMFGEGPLPESRADVDCNGYVNIADVVYILAYIFAGGAPPCASCETGTVYIVAAMDTEPFQFTDSLYSIPLNLSNFERGGVAPYVYDVMNDDFRSRYVDSYGGHLKFSFFVMTAEPFCESSNSDCDAVFTAMENFSGDVVNYGDELGWHYHHFAWLPSTLDPEDHHWSQIATFNGTEYGHGTDIEQCEKTLNHLLIDKNFFPATFRGGWTWENTDFSNWLNEIIPFDFSSISPYGTPAVPATYPFWNYYDWSTAPQGWGYYHPSSNDYRSPYPGDLKRSLFYCSPHGLSPDDIFRAFQRASQGEDVCMCAYGHTYGPLKTFFQQQWMDNINLLSRHFDVPFKFATSREAAQAALNIKGDTTAPAISIVRQGDRLHVSINGPIYQSSPYAALLSDGGYRRVRLIRLDNRLWLFDVGTYTSFTFAVAVSDAAGNVATARYEQ